MQTAGARAGAGLVAEERAADGERRHRARGEARCDIGRAVDLKFLVEIDLGVGLDLDRHDAQQQRRHRHSDQRQIIAAVTQDLPPVDLRHLAIEPIGGRRDRGGFRQTQQPPGLARLRRRHAEQEERQRNRNGARDEQRGKGKRVAGPLRAGQRRGKRRGHGERREMTARCHVCHQLQRQGFARQETNGADGEKPPRRGHETADHRIRQETNPAAELKQSKDEGRRADDERARDDGGEHGGPDRIRASL